MSNDNFKEESVEGIENFYRRIKELETQKPKGDIIVLFSGSDEATTGKSWCPECRRVEGLFSKVISKIRPGSILLHVKVGSLDDWRKPENAFRKDPKLKLTSVPTIMIWNTEKRLSTPQILDEGVLVLMFEAD